MRQHKVSFFALRIPNFVVRALLLLSCDLFFTLTTGKLLISVFFSFVSFLVFVLEFFVGDGRAQQLVTLFILESRGI